MAMQISTSLNVFHTSTERAIELCKQVGFERLDYNYTDFQEQIWKRTWAEEQEMARSIRGAADANGVKFSQMHGPVHGPNFSNMYHGLSLETFTELMRRSIRTASIIGAPWVVFHPTNRIEQYEPLEAIIRYNCEFFKKFTPLLEETGVGIAIENMYDRRHSRVGIVERHFAATPETLCELVDRINHPLVGICWDTGHGHLQRLPQGESIRMIGSRLKATHIQDNDGMKDQHLFPYYGSIDWQDTITALYEIDYKGDFTYETHNAVRPLPIEAGLSALRLGIELAKELVSDNRNG